MIKRNSKVADFRLKILNNCHQLFLDQLNSGIFNTSSNIWEIYDSLPSYKQMLYSFKKLTLENYLTKEQIKILSNASIQQETLN